MLIISMALAAISLILASYEDIRTKSVTNAVWWIYSAGLLMLFFEEGAGTGVFFECLIAVVIQEYIMCRTYGRADSHAFSCCAVFMVLSGKGLEGHILHMILALAMLSAVQILRGNIARGFKLKRPVPFIPYIALSFMISVIILHLVTTRMC
ncbi:MAG: hypothetical protein J6T50_04670 [Lachnospiraceae bacterium]|nr:hypothetical protein [Lachnospiraceae bacterium]